MMRILVVSAALLAVPVSAAPQVRIEVGLPAVGIGIQFPTFPRMVVVPGYPVYYAPDVNANLFFYDGLYWVLAGDTWYESPWFNGPWNPVAPAAVPAFVLRVPVGYYRAPPPWFQGWRRSAPPRWGEHWGGEWARRRAGWEHWDRATVPRPAPLPVYQREYGGGRYPDAGMQARLHDHNYAYWPRESGNRSAYQSHGMHGHGEAAANSHGGAHGGGRGGEHGGGHGGGHGEGRDH
ncbi:MAG TPA: hypothetical protein VFM45_09150 [Anaeromyxobacteraceae bacterium]|nr:hypothetical protein [Anaeromyxobacteraceae bacterium]